MASAFKRGSKLYIKWKDERGRWKMKVSKAKSLTEARRLAEDMDRKAERPRLGLEALPADTTMTVAELVRWWLKNHCPETSREIERGRLEKHVCSRPIGARVLHEATTEVWDAHLRGLELEPGSINKIRSMLHSAFERARKRKQWGGANPLTDVEPRKVTKKKFGTLDADEVPVLLAQVPDGWRNYFAAALYSALRKGELCGLLKEDVDLEHRTLFVGRSYGRDTTKGGHEDYLPIPEPLVPFLEDALERAGASRHVFPGRTQSSAPQKILRTALKKAGLVDGWVHVCRWCGADPEHHDDGEQRRCSGCGRKLWPKAIPRNMRFHDLRHTVITLLLRAGCAAHIVQKIARHADIRTTLGTYGHLMVGDLRDAMSKLPEVSFGASLVQAALDGQKEGLERADTASPSEALESGRSRDRTYDSCRVKAPDQNQAWSESAALEGERVVSRSSGVQILSPVVAAIEPFGAPVVQGSGSYPEVNVGLLTVRMVAQQLEVSTAAVYRLVDSGELPCVRLGHSNAIRVRPRDLERLTRGR